MVQATEPVIERRSLAEQVFEHIKRMILAEELKPGERVPEEKIAADFGLSRTPVREALRRLEAYGLIVLKPRSFAEVASVDLEEGEQIASVRAQLEGLAARMAAKKGDAEAVSKLRSIASLCTELFDSGDVAGTFMQDSRFHLAIAQASGNPYLVDLLERLDAKVQLYRLVRCARSPKIRSDLGFHTEIIEAIQKRDARRAESLMRQHILGAFDNGKNNGGE